MESGGVKELSRYRYEKALSNISNVRSYLTDREIKE